MKLRPFASLMTFQFRIQKGLKKKKFCRGTKKVYWYGMCSRHNHRLSWIHSCKLWHWNSNDTKEYDPSATTTRYHQKWQLKQTWKECFQWIFLLFNIKRTEEWSNLWRDHNYSWLTLVHTKIPSGWSYENCIKLLCFLQRKGNWKICMESFRNNVCNPWNLQTTS